MSALIAASAVGVPVLLLVLYVVGYFALSKALITEPRGEAKIRFYRNEWLTTVYGPAGRVEGMMTSRPVHVICDEDVFD